MSGIAPVVYASGIGNTNTATAGGSTPTILVGTDGSQLSDLGSGVFFMIGNNGSATAGSNSTIDILGNGNGVNATGTGNDINNDCILSVIKAALPNIFESNGSSETVTGSNNSLTAGTNGTIDLTGVSNNDVITSGTGTSLTIAASATDATGTIQSGTVMDGGYNDWLHVGYGGASTLHITGDGGWDNLGNGGTATLAGVDNALSTGTNASVSILSTGTGDAVFGGYGTNLTVQAGAEGAYGSIRSGQITDGGSGDSLLDYNSNGRSILVIAGSDNSDTMNLGGTVTIGGSGNTASGADDTMTFLNGTTGTIGGEFNTIDLGASASISVLNQANTVDAIGNGDTIGATNGGNTITLDGTAEVVNASAETVDLGNGSASVTVNGNNDAANAVAGGTVGFNGTGETANATGAIVWEDTSGTSVTVAGNNNLDSAAAGSVVGFKGTGETVWGSGATVWEDTSGTSVTVNGNNNLDSAAAGSVVGFNGTGETVWGSGATIHEDTSGTSVGVNGASDAISTVSGAALTVNGVSVTMETGGEGLETILDANGKISEEITTNTDGSWLDHLWDTTNQYSWTEEEFSHTANGSLAEETVKNANGTSMVDYFDVYGQDTYSQDIRYYDGDTLKEDLLLNHDGTQMVTWYGDYGYNHTIDETTTYSRWDSGVTFNGRYDQDYVGDILTEAGQLTYENTGGYLALQSNDWTGASYGGIAFGDDLPAAVTFNTSALTLNSSAILDDVLSPINDFVPADSDSGAGFSTILTPDTNGEDLWNVNTDDELAPTDPDAVDLSDDDFFVDPIVLNLNGGAVVTTDQNTNEVTFDMRGQGTLEGTGWITSGEGFLVIDKEGTGTITSSHEMISDMNELASYDSNGDGEITAADQRFDTPRVWVPGANGGPGSLFTLPQLGITEIGLTANMVDQADNGNLIKNTFTFDYANGTTGQGADVYFSLAGDPPIIASPAEASALAAGPPSYRNLGSTSDIAFFNPAAQLADVNNIVSAATAGGTAAPSSAAGAPESAQNSTSTLADIPAQSGQITVADVTSAGAAAAMGQNTVPDQATPAGWASLELSQGLTFISAGTAVQPVGTSGAGIAAPVAPPRCRNLPSGQFDRHRRRYAIRGAVRRRSGTGTRPNGFRRYRPFTSCPDNPERWAARRTASIADWLIRPRLAFVLISKCMVEGSPF